MEYGLYVSAAGADAQSKRMEVLSHNMANVDTTGFKEELAVLQARYSRAVRDGTDYPGSRDINDLGSGVSMTETITDYAPGKYKQTEGDWDVAIAGDGFFLVDDNGQQLLTRAGDFQVNAEGELLTQQGFKVLSSEETPIVINPNMPSSFQDDGRLDHSGGGELLAMVRPQSLGDLVRVGENTFRSLGPIAPVAGEDRQIKPGWLEMSGVRPMSAMVELIETSRAYEANVKMIQNSDQMTGSLISRILRTR